MEAVDYRKIFQTDPLCFTGAAIYNLAPIPQKEPFYDATGGPFTMTKVSKYLELYEKDGTVGMVPCSQIMEKTILPLILTGETKTFEEWMHRVYWQCRNNGFDGETAGETGRLEYILIDILAKRYNLPFHRFLGADRDYVTVYGSGGSTHKEGKELEKEMLHFMDCGYRTVKIKVASCFGTQIARDVERVELVRKTVGPDVKIAIDGNHALSAKEALDFAERVEKYDIAWFEEPVMAYDFEEYEKLCASTSMEIAAGESVRNHYLFGPYLKAGVRHFQPVPSSFAGFREWSKVRDMAKEHALRFTSGGLPLFSAPLIATAGEDAMEEFLEPCNQPVLDYMEVTLEQREGRFYIPDIPGLPFRLDIKRLRREGYLLSKEYFK